MWHLKTNAHTTRSHAHTHTYCFAQSKPTSYMRISLVFPSSLVEVMTCAGQSCQYSRWHLLIEIVPEGIVIILKAPQLHLLWLSSLFRTFLAYGRPSYQDREATEETLHGAQPALLSTLAFQLHRVHGHCWFRKPEALLLLKRLPVFCGHCGRTFVLLYAMKDVRQLSVAVFSSCPKSDRTAGHNNLRDRCSTTRRHVRFLCKLKSSSLELKYDSSLQCRVNIQ